MRMSRNGFIIHFVISLKPDRSYKATVVYSDIPRQTVVYQLYTTARGFDVAHAKCYILVPYTAKLSSGKTFAVGIENKRSRENFHGSSFF